MTFAFQQLLQKILKLGVFEIRIQIFGRHVAQKLRGLWRVVRSNSPRVLVLFYDLQHDCLVVRWVFLEHVLCLGQICPDLVCRDLVMVVS